MTRSLIGGAALLLLGLACQPAWAAGPGFPKPLEAEFTAAKQNMVTDQVAALRHIATAEAMVQRVADPQQRAIAMATARWLAAEAHLRSDAPDRAAPLLENGLKLIAPIREPIKVRGDLLMSQGALFMQREQAVQALSNYQQAYRVFAAVKEPRSQSVALQNIAALYQTANDGVRAEAYFRQAADVYDGDPMLSLSLHNNRGNVLFILDRYTEASDEFQQALTIARQLSQPVLEARVLVNLARAQINLKHFDAADRTLARGFELIKDGNATMLRRHLLATAARLAADRGDDVRAAQLIRECFDGVDLRTTTADFRNAHLYAREILARIGQTGLAYQHLESLKRLDDEASKVATTTGAALMAARFNYAAQQAHILKLRAEEADRVRRFQLILFLGIVASTLVIITLLSFGLVTLRRSRNQVRAANVVLGETNVALEKALRAKTEFLATTSHEIRTPLNGILGMTQVMLADSKLNAEMRDRIGIVHGAGVTMRSLVDDILDVAKMETGNLTVDAAPMDLCASLREVTRIWQEQAHAKGLLFRLELSHAPHWIVSDAGRLRQIVFNLLSNAVKFTAKGVITLRAVDEGEGAERRLRLSVSDSGIGIPPEKFEEIFESFRQVDAGTTRQFGGTGLGLTICRNLARALGGDITVESEAGSGARFIVDLPLVLAEAPEAAVAATGVGGMLVLDRNPIARSMLRTLFEPRVSALRFVATRDEALAALADSPVDYLLLDEATLKASDGDPLETLRALVAAAPTALSGVLWIAPDSEVRSQILASGVGKIIEKPVAGAVLVAAFVTSPKEKIAEGGSDPLVSRAA